MENIKITEADKGTIIKLLNNEEVIVEVDVAKEKSEKGLIYLIFNKDTETDMVGIESGCLQVSQRDTREAIKVLAQAYLKMSDCPKHAQVKLLIELTEMFGKL